MPVFRTVKSWLASSFIHNHIIIQNTLPNVASATVMKIIVIALHTLLFEARVVSDAEILFVIGHW